MEYQKITREKKELIHANRNRHEEMQQEEVKRLKQTKTGTKREDVSYLAKKKSGVGKHSPVSEREENKAEVIRHYHAATVEEADMLAARSKNEERFEALREMVEHDRAIPHADTEFMHVMDKIRNYTGSDDAGYELLERVKNYSLFPHNPCVHDVQLF